MSIHQICRWELKSSQQYNILEKNDKASLLATQKTKNSTLIAPQEMAFSCFDTYIIEGDEIDLAKTLDFKTLVTFNF